MHNGVIDSTNTILCSSIFSVGESGIFSKCLQLVYLSVN